MLIEHCASKTHIRVSCFLTIKLSLLVQTQSDDQLFYYLPITQMHITNPEMDIVVMFLRV